MAALLILVTGLLGSFHCLGMCGPIAIGLGAFSGTWKSKLVRQLVFSTGRIFTYSVMGATAGFLGSHFSERLGSWVNVSSVLAIVAGVILFLQGMALTGIFARPSKSNAPCLAAGFFSSFLSSPRKGGVFLAGMFTGMLPCGLVYGVLALAASSQHMLRGGGIMMLFGAGTVPMMVVTGLAGSLVGPKQRQRVLRFAAWTVATAGVLSIVRGLGFLHFGDLLDVSDCPLCH